MKQCISTYQDIHFQMTTISVPPKVPEKHGSKVSGAQQGLAVRSKLQARDPAAKKSALLFWATIRMIINQFDKPFYATCSQLTE